MEENPQQLITPPPQVLSETPLQKPAGKISKSTIMLLLLAAVIVTILALTVFMLYQKNAQKGRFESEAFNAFRQGNYSATKTAAQNGLKYFKDDVFLMRKMVDSLTAEGNATGKEKEALAKAQPYIDKALTINPNEPETLLSAGYAYEAAGNYEKALELYQKAAQIKPTAIAFFHVGHTLSFLNREPEAQAAYQKASKLDPNNPQIGLVTARILHDEGKDDESLKILTNIGKVTSLDKSMRAEAYTDAAIIYLEKSDRVKASKFAKQAVDIDETYSPALGIYGFSLVRTAKDYTEGRKYILKAIEQNGRISLNYLLAGELLRSVGYRTQALVYQKNGIDKVTNDNTLVGDTAKQQMRAKMYFEIAETYSQLGDAQQTASYLAKAIEANPKYKTVIENAVKSSYFKNIKNNPVFTSFLSHK